MYTAIFKKTKSGYVAWIEEIPGVNTQGKTKKDTTANLRDALREFVIARRKLSKREYPKKSFVREPFSARASVRT
ncbi:MAG: type II toxin-antitoxin system HicB family antitoxin [bacterium]|nr:type II toxin-antitoxin system HicB family antitoxin [bacterium]